MESAEESALQGETLGLFDLFWWEAGWGFFWLWFFANAVSSVALKPHSYGICRTVRKPHLDQIECLYFLQIGVHPIGPNISSLHF